MNKVILIGRLTKDAELRVTPQGTSTTMFTIAVDRRFSGKDGQRQADFINCTAWRQTAEFISKWFQKGSMISVVGSMQNRNWEDKDGVKHYATDVVVDEAYFCGSKSDSNTGNNTTTEEDPMAWINEVDNADDLPDFMKD